MDITIEMVAAKISLCVTREDTFEARVSAKAKHHDSALTDIAVVYRQLKTDLYALRQDYEITNAIVVENEAIAQYVSDKVANLYYRAVEMLARFDVELKNK